MQRWSWMMAGCLLATSVSAQNLPAPVPAPAGVVQGAAPPPATPQYVNENDPEIQRQRAMLTDAAYEVFVELSGGRAPGTTAPPRTLPMTAKEIQGPHPPPKPVALEDQWQDSLNLPTGAPQPGGVYPQGTVDASAQPASTSSPVAAGDPASAPNNPPIPPDQLPPLPTAEQQAQLAAQKAYRLDQDFQAALSAQLGLTPEQIRQLRRMVDQQERAASEPPGPPSQAVTGSLTVSLAPGARPPVLRMAMGSVSSFVVVDATGAPWPVENFRVGNAMSDANPTGFSVNRLDGPQGSAFTIDVGQRYAQSNLVLKLAGTPTPILLDLVSGQEKHDARLEIRVQGRGPQARVVHSSLPQATDSALLPVLDGIAPVEGKPLKVEGVEGIQGWLTPSGTMIIRSPYKMVSPASRSFVSSASDHHVYEISPVPSLLIMRNGTMASVSVKGW